MLKFFRLPFATTGDKTAVPDAVDSNGNVSYSQGYGFDYQRQKTDPAAKNIERNKMNQILFDITTAIAEIQSQGVPDYITSTLNGGTAYSYDQYAIVKYSGALYISLVAANTALPSDATKWALLATPALLQQAANYSAVAGGTVNALTAAFTPAIASLPAAPGTLSLLVRAAGANTTTTPTFAADSTAAKTIVKGNNLPLVAGDIAGAGMWLELQYDATLDKWVLQNPAYGVSGVTSGNLQNQTYTAFTTGGVSGTFTLTPSPALASYAAGQRFRVKFSAGGNGSDTINVSALGAKNLKQYDSAGNKVAPVIASGCLFDVEYDGVDFVILDPLPTAGASIQGAFKNLAASSTGLTANVSVTADEIAVEDASNNYKTLRAVALTIAGTSVGANALDAGTIAASTWYSVWVIYNPTTQTTAGLLSLSATAPTLPSGYTFKARVGWVRTDGTANKYPLGFKQSGRKVQYVVAAGSNVTRYPAMASGTATFPTAVAVAAFVPPTAGIISAVLTCNGNAQNSGGAVASPNSATGIDQANPSLLQAIIGNYSNAISAGNIVLEGANLYWGTFGTVTASNSLSVSGWEDNI